MTCDSNNEQNVAILYYYYLQQHVLIRRDCLYVFQSGQFSEDMIPTVGFNMRKITKGNVTIKVGTWIILSYVCCAAWQYAVILHVVVKHTV